MPSTVFEIIEIADGEYVLQRTDAADEPIVSIRFSAEAREFLADSSADIAKVMIEAGIHEVEEIMDEQFTTAEQDPDSSRVIH